MRVFALSDIHVDYEVNADWVRDLSQWDYRDDLLILAGDVTHKPSLLAWCLNTFALRFKRVLFVPGNHDLWVLGDQRHRTSLEKFDEVARIVETNGASMQPYYHGPTLIAPLLGWYDYSFGEPSEELRDMWMDYRACRWPEGYGPAEVSTHFAKMNLPLAPVFASKVITFSHFLPRLDLVPAFVSRKFRVLDPVLGSTVLDRQLRQLHSKIHVYGHSHINRSVRIDAVQYVNNAFGYPREDGLTSKQLLSIDEI